MVKNIAKCKLCESVIQSFFKGDYAECKCGEIAVSEGDAMFVHFKDPANFLRIDEDGHTYPIQYNEKKEDDGQENLGFVHTLSKEECIKGIDNLITIYDNMPESETYRPINHKDFQSLLMIVSSFFKAS